MDWNDLNVILAIARCGSLSGAARALKINHSTVFRRINSIEEKLQVRFFDRLPQGYVLTEAGEAALRTAERIDEEVHDLTRELMGRDLRLQGSIRVTAPEGISYVLLAPLLAKFCKLHPDIHIDLIATGTALQLARREADLAVRVTNKPPDTSIGRYVCGFSFAIYAARQYMKKQQQLGNEQYEWLLTDDSRDWFAAAVWKKLERMKARTVLSSNSTMAVVSACLNGLGVAPLPCFLGDSETRLVRLQPPSQDMQLQLWLLMHPDLRHTTRVRALMTFLKEALGEQKDLIEGNIIKQ